MGGVVVSCFVRIPCMGEVKTESVNYNSFSTKWFTNTFLQTCTLASGKRI